MKVILSKLPIGSQAWKTYRRKLVSSTYYIFSDYVWNCFNGVLIEAGDKLIIDFGLTSARWQVLDSFMDGPIAVAEIAW